MYRAATAGAGATTGFSRAATAVTAAAVCMTHMATHAVKRRVTFMQATKKTMLVRVG
jgi:hypothetical protein